MTEFCKLKTPYNVYKIQQVAGGMWIIVEILSRKSNYYVCSVGDWVVGPIINNSVDIYEPMLDPVDILKEML